MHGDGTFLNIGNMGGDWGKGCTKVLLAELHIKAANCEGRGVQHTQVSV
jgi:hypothetical protein